MDDARLLPDSEVLLAERILALVAEERGVSVAVLLAHSGARMAHRTRYASDRQVAMFLAREKTRLSLPELGRIFKRDHSTVQTGIQRVKKKLDAADAWTRDLIELIRVRLDNEPR